MYFKHIVVYIAWSILLLHNLTPHLHHGEVSNDEHEKNHVEAMSFLDWVKLPFHEDIGEGHLENFISADFSFVSVEQIGEKLPPLLLINVLLYHEDNGSEIRELLQPIPILPDKLFQASSFLRGPPIV